MPKNGRVFWIYLPYYRKICQNRIQHQVLDSIEAYGNSAEFTNSSGGTVIKHSATQAQFEIIERKMKI